MLRYLLSERRDRPGRPILKVFIQDRVGPDARKALRISPLSVSAEAGVISASMLLPAIDLRFGARKVSTEVPN